MAAAFTPGRTILEGRYRLVRPIGEGGMGSVFEAIQEGLERRVAVKTLRANLAHDERLATRFRSEAKTLARLHHPHIAQVIDYGVDEDRPIIVMEYLEGEDLRAVLTREELLDADGAIAIVAPILRALGAAHEQGIVHRDVKPENVFIVWDDGHPIPKLLDFGIAKRLDAERVTSTHGAVGTAAYMAPEQVQSSRDVGPAADQYAVGVILYEALTGGLPHLADSAAELAAKKLMAAPEDIRALSPGLPEPIAAAVMRALSFEPSQRFESVTDLRRALEGTPRTAVVSHPSAEGRTALPIELQATLLPMQTDAAPGPERPPPRRTAAFEGAAATPSAPSSGEDAEAVPSSARSAARARSPFALGLAVVTFVGVLTAALWLRSADEPAIPTTAGDPSGAREPGSVMERAASRPAARPPSTDPEEGASAGPDTTSPSGSEAASAPTDTPSTSGPERASAPVGPPLPSPRRPRVEGSRTPLPLEAPPPAPAATSVRPRLLGTEAYDSWAAGAHVRAARPSLERCVVAGGLPAGVSARYSVRISAGGRVLDVRASSGGSAALDRCMDAAIRGVDWSPAIGGGAGRVDVQLDLS